jgi:hypothetical protein
MMRVGRILLAIPALAIAHEFTFVVGSPVASQDFHFKTAAFVFRTEGCSAAEKPKISATAEGINHNERQSIPLKVITGSKPDIYAVFQSWPKEGDWVVDLEGTCGSLNAGALVPIGPNGFIRESARFFSHPATTDEINASLKAMNRGSAK